jgi:hypothetical protein
MGEKKGPAVMSTKALGLCGKIDKCGQPSGKAVLDNTTQKTYIFIYFIRQFWYRGKI